MSLTVGVDEAGRGPLAGPVVAAAVCLDPARPIAGLRDSKQLSAAQRAGLERLIRERAHAFGIGEAGPEEIDSINILQATLLAMRRALMALGCTPDCIIIDGKQAPQLHDLYPGTIIRTLVRADQTESAVSAASILAKTWRDARMAAYDRQYPGYGFARHQGYPTTAHCAALRALGPTPIHRRSFGPVKSLVGQAPRLA